MAASAASRSGKPVIGTFSLGVRGWSAFGVVLELSQCSLEVGYSLLIELSLTLDFRAQIFDMIRERRGRRVICALFLTVLLNIPGDCTQQIERLRRRGFQRLRRALERVEGCGSWHLTKLG